ncbi:hypothetical protein LINPERPRIM_LOCUS28937 [Linum perenne]
MPHEVLSACLIPRWLTHLSTSIGSGAGFERNMGIRLLAKSMMFFDVRMYISGTTARSRLSR